jgi:hypothetical protein
MNDSEQAALLHNINIIMQFRLTPSEIQEGRSSGSYPEEPLDDLSIIQWDASTVQPRECTVVQVINLKKAHKLLQDKCATFLPRT